MLVRTQVGCSFRSFREGMRPSRSNMRDHQVPSLRELARAALDVAYTRRGEALLASTGGLTVPTPHEHWDMELPEHRNIGTPAPGGGRHPVVHAFPW